jgi:endonuclease/exonuclease/phosphatase family metal-dependent hydrolase
MHLAETDRAGGVSWIRTLAVVGILAIVGAAVSGVSRAEPLRVMSFNIRYGTAADGDNEWPKRRGLLLEMLRQESPDIIGTQEALRFQLDELGKALGHFGEVGVGRDDGKTAGEYSAILYDRRRLEALDQGTFWFAEEPAAPGALTWSSTFARICSWVRLRDRTSGREFYVYNQHWDHQSQESREKSSQKLLARIAAREPAGSPVVVTGDFNADEQNPAFRRLLSATATPLQDSFRMLHADEPDVGTFHNFQGGRAGGKIDAVLVSPEWHVNAAEIVRMHQEQIYPSDHYPVTATIELPAAQQ